MKILAIAADLDINNLGGAEAHFIEVLKRIAPKTEKVTVFTGTKTFVLVAKVEVVPVNYPHLPNFFGLLYILFATPRAVLHARKEKFDLIWAKQEYPQSQVGALVKLFTGLPLYITSQNPNLASEELVLKGPLAILQGWLAKVLRILISWAFRQADVVAAVSIYSADLAKKMGAKKVVVIPNGVDKGNYQKPKKSRRGLAIITVSSLIPRNGVDVLIKACKLLSKETDWKLTIAGDGPLRRGLERLAADKRITFLGWVENKRIPVLLASHNLFVRTSRFEGFGSAFIEAMAAGVPVIGTPVGGITDFLTDGKTGLFVPVDDPAATAKTIEKLADDNNLREQITANALRLVSEKYSWDNISQKVFTQMQKCLSD